MAEDKPQSMLFGSLSEAISSLAHAVCGLAREVSNHNQASGLERRLAQIDERLNIMAATQQELAADLRVVLEQQKKTQGEIAGVQTEVNTLKEKIIELEEIISSNPTAEAIPELVQAVADVKAQAQVVDDGIPDPLPEARQAGQATTKPRPVP